MNSHDLVTAIFEINANNEKTREGLYNYKAKKWPNLKHKIYCLRKSSEKQRCFSEFFLIFGIVTLLPVITFKYTEISFYEREKLQFENFKFKFQIPSFSFKCGRSTE